MKKWVVVLAVFSLAFTMTFGLAETDELTYEYAFVRGNSEYQMYYVFDMDDMVVRSFVTNDHGVMAGTFTGDLENGFSIHWMEGWDETFIVLDDVNAKLIDNDGFESEFQVASVAEAEAILNQDGYFDMELE